MNEFTEVEKQQVRDGLEDAMSAHDGDDAKVIIVIWNEGELQSISKGFDANGIVIAMHKLANQMLKDHYNVEL